MRVRRLLLGLATAGAATAAGAVAGERRLLSRMAEQLPPPDWTEPRFPDGHEIMVPTDDGAELLVGVAGPDDGPVIVLVHGLTSNHHDWGPVARRLVDAGYRVVGINQRGHGGSTVGSAGFGPARQGADLGQVLTALGLERVTLVGHSMGGVAAMSLLTLSDHPGSGRVYRLALVATLADTVSPDRRASLKLGNTQPYQGLAQHHVHAPTVARFVFGKKTPSRVLVDHALASNRRCPLETRRGAATGLLGYDIRSLLPGIDLPTVVICGTHDRLTPLRENRSIADAVPGAQLVTVADAGHLLLWEQPQTVADAIAAITTTSRTATGA